MVSLVEGLPNLKKNEYKPLYIKLSDIISDYINDNLAPGDLIPSEQALIQRYGISRMTVRLAVQRLETEELVRKVQGKGTFVAEPKHREYVRGFQNLEDTLAEQGITVTNVLLELADVYPPQNWAKQLNLPAGSQARIIRRLKITGNKPLALEVRVLPLKVATKFAEEDFKEKPIFDLLSVYPETEIVRVIYTMTSSLIPDREAKEMDVPRGSPVLVRTGVYYNKKERPVMVGKVTFLAERIEMRFEFRREDKNWGIVTVV
jgi:GntR family transcriptional regulator